MNEIPTNPNDFKVVSFHNSETFNFLPEYGCMYNGTAINGNLGGPGIKSGETMIMPYHIAHQLALNLAKYAMNSTASSVPMKDEQGNIMVKAIWNDVELERMKLSYLKELYSEDRPARATESEILLAKMEEFRKLTDERFAALGLAEKPVQETDDSEKETEVTFKDKAEILAELDKRGIKHDKRSSKETLEALLA